MSPAALVVALLAPHAWPLRRRSPLLSLYGRLALSAAKRLDAGDRNSGMLAWFVLMAVVLVPVAIVTAIAAYVHPALVFALDVAFLYGTLRFLATTARLSEVQRALREGDVAAAAQRF